jgi:hypothetical protein
MVKTSIFATIVFLIFLSTSLFAEENNSNQRISVYMHPTSLLASSLMNLMAADQKTNFNLELTGEVPLGKYASFIVNPYVSWFSFGLWGRLDSFKAGSGIGARIFPNGKTDGFYFQLMPSIFYEKEKDVREDWDLGSTTRKETGIYADALGYIGYALKFSKVSAFLDVGLGAYKKLSGSHKVIYDCNPNYKCKEINEKENGLAIDINFGIGLPI